MDRFNIFCPKFPLCPACLIDVDVANTQTTREAKSFFANLGINDFKVHVGSLKGWRCRAKLVVRGTVEEPLIGLYKTGSHEVIDLPDCCAHHPLINQAISYLRKWISLYRIQPYDERTGKGTLRYIQFAVDREKQRVQIALILNQRQDEAALMEKQNEALNSLWTNHPNFWHSVWLNFNKQRDNVILGKLWTHFIGEEWLRNQFCGRQICFHPASFAQANPEMFENLLIDLRQYVPQGTKALEYYAGGGVIGLSIANHCAHICFNEIVPLAETCFNETTKNLSAELKNKLSYVCGPAEKQTDLLNSDTDLVIVDPPRKGIDKELLERLCSNSLVKRLIYVSCGWSSFKNDCTKLLENRWELFAVSSYLFFPGSEHIEILAIFNRKEN